MKITATTTAADLATLLGPANVAAAEARRLEMGQAFHMVTLRNVDATNAAHVESDGITATAANGFTLPSGGLITSQVELKTMNLRDVSVISAAATADLRVIIN